MNKFLLAEFLPYITSVLHNLLVRSLYEANLRCSGRWAKKGSLCTHRCTGHILYRLCWNPPGIMQSQFYFLLQWGFQNVQNQTEMTALCCMRTMSLCLSLRQSAFLAASLCDMYFSRRSTSVCQSLPLHNNEVL